MTYSETYIALKTIVVKEVLRFSRIWVQTIIPPVITMSLYFVIFGSLIGSRIGEMDGFRYMDYIIPGLIMMAVITNSYANVVSSFYGAKFHHHIEEMLVATVPNHIIVLGFVAGGVCTRISRWCCGDRCIYVLWKHPHSRSTHRIQHGYTDLNTICTCRHAQWNVRNQL